MEFRFEKELDEKYYKLLNEEFDKHAEKNGISCEYKSFNFTARDGEKVVGILTGHSYYNEVHISDLIVLEEYRNQHIGMRLMQEVENYFKDSEYNLFTVNTFGFQAPEFYKKCGYSVDYVRENENEPKLSKYFLVKRK